jgi:hypothetical protein
VAALNQRLINLVSTLRELLRLAQTAAIMVAKVPKTLPQVQILTEVTATIITIRITWSIISNV